MFRFSLATLLFIVLLAALGAASLKYAAPVTQEITVTGVFIILMACTLLAVHGRGRLRWFSSGLALTGWGYFVALFLFVFLSEPSPMWQSSMVTERLAGVLYQTMHGVAAEDGDDLMVKRPVGVPEGVPQFRDFLRICHALTGMALAFCGGAFVCALQTRRGRDDVG